MTMVNVGGWLAWPTEFSVNGGVFAYNSVLLDASGEKAANVFQVPKAGNIRKIWFRTSTITTGGDLDCRIETVGSDGFPTGTLFAANTNAAKTVANADDNVSLVSAALTADATVVAGDVIAVVLVAPVTFNGSIAQYNTNLKTLYGSARGANALSAAYAFSSPYAITVEYDDGTYAPIPGIVPATNQATTNFNSGSAQPERGMKFTIPFKCRVTGAMVNVTQATNTATYDVILYDTDGSTVLASTSVTKALRQTTANLAHVLFSTPVTLTKGASYRLVMKATSVNNVGAIECTALAVATMGGFPSGDVAQLTIGTAGSWTETTTTRPLHSLMIDQVDDGTGTGTTIAGTPMLRGMVG